jgi:hypothetical protein
MKLDAKELRFLEHYLKVAQEVERKKLKTLDPDSDEHADLANDLMLLDVLLSRIARESEGGAGPARNPPRKG